MKQISLGVEEGALYKKTETLLREYNSMQARLKNLEIDLVNTVSETTFEEEADTIEGVYFQRHNEEGMPGGGGVGDKTSSVALRWRDEHKSITHDIWGWFVADRSEMKQESNFLNSVLKKVDNAIGSLSSDEQLIVKGYYIENKPWYDIAHKVEYAERHCKRMRTRAIWYMSKSIFSARKVR